MLERERKRGKGFKKDEKISDRTLKMSSIKEKGQNVRK